MATPPQPPVYGINYTIGMDGENERKVAVNLDESKADPKANHRTAPRRETGSLVTRFAPEYLNMWGTAHQVTVAGSSRPLLSLPYVKLDSLL